MFNRRLLADRLATALVTSSWDEASLLQRCQQVLRSRQAWILPFVQRQLNQYGRPPRPSAFELAKFILNDTNFRRSRLRRITAAYSSTDPRPEMDWRLPFASTLPVICTTRDLVEFLGISFSQLDSFADLKSFAHLAKDGIPHHYHYRILSKPGGGARVIESPKPRLKLVQQQILRSILDFAPPHKAAHGFRRGHSISSFVAPHVGRTVVARVDLRDFFPSIRRARVAAMFRTFGYPEKVAQLLAGISTNSVPNWAWDALDDASQRSNRNTRAAYNTCHLPQGAPTSPAIANLCAYRLDCRLNGIASAAGGSYTRYADDLAFSGDAAFARRIERFLVHVTATVAEEGFIVHHRKTRVMRQSVRQHLAGLVVNKTATLRRDSYDRLKATLVNCVEHGVDSQNRERHMDFKAHLNGRVAFVEQINPNRGQRLRKLFQAIVW